MIPSVTQVISPFADFSGVRPDVLEHAASRGTAVHRACAAIIQGLWCPPVSEECIPYIQSFAGWMKTVDEVVLVEADLKDETLGFCGHPDLICRIKGDRGYTVVDYKTPLASKRAWAVQLAAYAHLAKEGANLDIQRVLALRLRNTGGSPIVDEFTRDIDQNFAVFLNALTAWKFFRAE